jgi:hypothetical protein
MINVGDMVFDGTNVGVVTKARRMANGRYLYSISTPNYNGTDKIQHGEGFHENYVSSWKKRFEELTRG